MIAAHKVDLDALAKIATPVIEGAGYELVDLEWKRELGSWILRLFIDKAGGPHAPGDGITLDGCAEVNRELSIVLDVSELLPGSDAYSLEVSSPGIDRPLRRLVDFTRAVGQKVKVRTLRPLGPPPGRRNFVGMLTATTEAGLLSIDVGDRVCEVPFTEVEKANLVFDWSAQKPAKRSREAEPSKTAQGEPQDLSSKQKHGNHANGSR